jgi:hypothetical protein
MSKYIPGVNLENLHAPYRIYCDVDGVLALFSTEYDLHKIITENLDPKNLGNSHVRLNNCIFRNQKPRSVDVFWNSQSVQQISELSHRQDVDFVWLTTWKHEAVNHLNSLFNIDAKGYLDWVINEQDNRFEDVKLRDLLHIEEVKPSQKFVWIDDAAITDDAEKQLQIKQFIFKTVKPHNVDGITFNDIHEIENFLREGK